MQRRFQLFSALIVCLAPAAATAQEQCSPDCTHPTRACVCALDARAVVTPIGSFDRQPAQLRRALDPGDEVAGIDDAAIVGLTCPGGSDVKLHGRFRAIVMPPAAGQDCAINLLAGSVDVLTNTPTQVSSGETLMGSKRTMYGMRVGRDATVECTVFEGEVAVQNLKTGATRALGANVKASWKSGQLVQAGAPLERADLLQTTGVYVRADIARARAQGVAIEDPDSFQRALQARYAAVLSRPNDPGALIDLAALQTVARITVPALHHLERAERLNPQPADQRAALAATKLVAYRQVGREKDASAEGEKLRTLDQARYAMVQKVNPKVQRLPRGAYEPGATAARPADTATTAAPAEPARPPAPVTRAPIPAARPPQAAPIVAATAMPSIVPAGQPSTITTTVKSQDGRPVNAARVVLSAGGGTFARAGQPRIEGVTDANGVFRTTWQCGPCAAAYSITVEAAAPSQPPARTIVEIRTR